MRRKDWFSSLEPVSNLDLGVRRPSTFMVKLKKCLFLIKLVFKAGTGDHEPSCSYAAVVSNCCDALSSSFHSPDIYIPLLHVFKSLSSLSPNL